MQAQRTTDQIINIGVQLMRQRRLIDMQLRELYSELEPRFPGQRTQEEISTAVGRAVRTVRREYWIKPGSLDAVRKILGTAYAHMIDVEQPLSVTSKLLALAKDERSDVGRLVRQFIVVDRRRRIVFHEPLSDVVVTDGAAHDVVDMEQSMAREDRDGH